MAIQTEFNDAQNFTGRARIKQKSELFSLKLLDRDERTARILVTFDRALIERECRLRSDEPKDMILDIFVLGEIRRHVLPEHKSQDDFDLPDLPDGANLEFRLKVVSRAEGSSGKILASTGGPVKLQAGDGEKGTGEINKGIFHPKPSHDIGDRVWQVIWSANGDFEIFVNADYFHKFAESPTFSAHVFPEIVRNIATGILLRYDDVGDIDEDSLLARWVTFIQERLEFPLEGEEAAKLRDAENIYKLDMVEDIVQEFTSRRWRNGKTLLEEVL